MDLYPGQFVTCVDASPSNKGVPCNLERGRIYTVRDIPTPRGVRVIEADVPRYHGHCDAYRASRFRPVRQTSIDVFTEMLVGAPESEDA